MGVRTGIVGMTVTGVWIGIVGAVVTGVRTGKVGMMVVRGGAAGCTLVTGTAKPVPGDCSGVTTTGWTGLDTCGDMEIAGSCRGATAGTKARVPPVGTMNSARADGTKTASRGRQPISKLAKTLYVPRIFQFLIRRGPCTKGGVARQHAPWRPL